jgi:hypothetical protein
MKHWQRDVARALSVVTVCVLALLQASETPAFREIERSPAIVTDNARDPDFYNDFMRITFVPSSVEVRTPSRPNAVRAFFGSTRFYDPPIPVDAIAEFNGFSASASLDLIAMTCRPRTPTADARYATWPNLARMIVTDLGTHGYHCPPPAAADSSNAAYCLATQYQDAPAQPVINTLIAALQFGQQLFALNNGNWLYDNYGIDYNHSGLGMVVRGPSVPLTAAEALEQSVVPEYLLRNVNLASANCRCIRVPSYPGRDEHLLPPKFVWANGDLDDEGRCVSVVSRLPEGPHR